jgi:hypothetical protein
VREASRKGTAVSSAEARSSREVRAFFAILIDLIFLLTFDLVFNVMALVLRTVWRIRVVLMTFLLLLISLPFRLAHWASVKLEHRAQRARPEPDSQAHLKPAWAAHDEI